MNNINRMPTQNPDGLLVTHTQNATIINMETNVDEDNNVAAGNRGDETTNAHSMQRNFFSLFNGARSQQQRAAEHPRRYNTGNNGGDTQQSNEQASHFATSHDRPARSWRMNLNNVLSFSTATPTEALRSLITHSSSFRYMPLSTNENVANAAENLHMLLTQDANGVGEAPLGYRVSTRILRAMEEGGSNHQQVNGDTTVLPVDESFISAPITPPEVVGNRQNEIVAQHQPGTSSRNSIPQSEYDEDNNVISDMFVNGLTHFARYMPFIGILFVKFVHDNLLGLLDLVLLHGVVYQMNKSVRKEVAKLPNKSYGILMRDFFLVTVIVIYRFLLSSAPPEPFGLLVPPLQSVTIEVSPFAKGSGANTNEQVPDSETLKNYINHVTSKPQSSETIQDAVGNAVTITKSVSLGVLIYYVAINDLILKLITMLLKISVTMLPTTFIGLKPRARMYVFLEFLSQWIRALAPMHQWVMYVFGTYTGLEIITGVLFSSLYMGAKVCEFVERGKCVKKSFLNLMRNMEYARKPTVNELEAAGPVCPICHDSFSAPIILECGHLFCDECVTTWFKREQTCPMCRAKINEDPTWQDGSTTFFYQFC